ncbi:hypothetical protein CYMTET_23672, partial [Cymbomonas tetramitiformis]
NVNGLKSLWNQARKLFVKTMKITLTNGTVMTKRVGLLQRMKICQYGTQEDLPQHPSLLDTVKQLHNCVTKDDLHKAPRLTEVMHEWVGSVLGLLSSISNEQHPNQARTNSSMISEMAKGVPPPNASGSHRLNALPLAPVADTVTPRLESFNPVLPIKTSPRVQASPAAQSISPPQSFKAQGGRVSAANSLAYRNISNGMKADTRGYLRHHELAPMPLPSTVPKGKMASLPSIEHLLLPTPTTLPAGRFNSDSSRRVQSGRFRNQRHR